MALDLAALRAAVARHGRVARVVIASVSGSSPREAGASMLVWDTPDGIGQSGTIGGGALEYEAARHAFARHGATRHALGPELGQCCGGAVTLWTEVWDAAALAAIDGQDPVVRGAGERPLAVSRLIDRARARGEDPATRLVDGWLVEPLARAVLPLWIWGAGHVGRALVDVLSPLPDLAITWIDTGPQRFPDVIPPTVTALPAEDPARVMAHAPTGAAHLILTYSHALDLALCHAALRHEFAFCGLIGSDTKRARFRKRLGALGHGPARIATITCPIGEKGLGKHPQAIAIGVAAEILTLVRTRSGTDKDRHSWPIHSSASGA